MRSITLTQLLSLLLISGLVFAQAASRFDAPDQGSLVDRASTPNDPFPKYAHHRRIKRQAATTTSKASSSTSSTTRTTSASSTFTTRTSVTTSTTSTRVASTITQPSTSSKPSSSSSSTSTKTSSAPSSTPTTYKYTQNQFLAILLNTYVWTLQKMAASACLISPSLYTDCTNIGWTTIPNNYEIFLTSTPAYSYTYSYMYSSVEFWGYGYSNFTKLGPSLVNITSQALYTYCLANSTCAQAYSSTANSTTAIRAYSQSCVNSIKAELPVANDRLWQPPTSYAYALSTMTTLPGTGSEVLGIHDGITLALAKQNTTLEWIQAAYALKMTLTGGAEMLESLIHITALRRLTSYTQVYTPTFGQPATTTTSRLARRVGDGSKIYDLEEMEKAKDQDLLALAKLRGPARVQIEGLGMSRYKELGLSALSGADLSTYASIENSLLGTRATCDRASDVDRYLHYANVGLNVACDALSAFTSFRSLSSLSISSLQGPYFNAARVFGLSQYNTVTGTVALIDGLVQASGGSAPVYPGASFWSGVGTGTTLFDLITTWASVPANPAAAIPGAVYASIGCTLYGIAQNFYNMAGGCCAKDCNAVACVSASIACGMSSGVC